MESDTWKFRINYLISQKFSFLSELEIKISYLQVGVSSKWIMNIKRPMAPGIWAFNKDPLSSSRFLHLNLSGLIIPLCLLRPCMGKGNMAGLFQIYMITWAIFALKHTFYKVLSHCTQSTLLLQRRAPGWASGWRPGLWSPSALQDMRGTHATNRQAASEEGDVAAIISIVQIGKLKVTEVKWCRQGHIENKS